MSLSASKSQEPLTTFILGAGFSANAGLPLQNEFSSLLVSDEFGSDLDIAITKTVKNFLTVAFGWSVGRELPTLEDFFTSIDLAAGTGHNLGIRRFTPKVLRAIRRMAIHRIFSVLDRRFVVCPDITRLLTMREGRSAFVVLNWDIVQDIGTAGIRSEDDIVAVRAIDIATVGRGCQIRIRAGN